MSNFWHKKIRLSPLPFGVLLILGILIPFSPFLWDNYQLLLVAIVPTIYFTYASFHLTNIHKLPILSTDIVWLVFLSIGLGSYIWAINPTLIWSNFFGWVTLLLWMLMFRSLAKLPNFLKSLEKLLLGLLLLFFFQSILFFFIYSSIFNFSPFLDKVATIFNFEITNFLDKDIYRWHKFFGYNANVVALHFLSLYPFLLFYQSKTTFFRLLKWLCSIWLIFVIYKAGSQGVFLTLIILLLYYFWITYRPKYLFKISFLGIIGLLIGRYVVFNEGALLTNHSLTQPGSLGNRIHPIINSIRVWTEAPFLGYGFGNWHLVAFKYDNLDLGELFKSVDPLKGIIDFRLLKSHTIYSKYLVELGIFGLAFFLYPFIVSLQQLFKQATPLTALQKALGGLLITYLSAAFFYRNANFFPDYFSRIQFLTFCGLGILTSFQTQKYKRSKVVYALCSGLALSSLAWCLYEQSTNNRYETALEKGKKNPTSALQEIASVYHPVFKTTYKAGTSIAIQLAKLYANQGDNNRAERYYALGLQSAPNDEKILFDYANFLLKTGRNMPKAKQYAQAVLKTNNRYQFEVLFTLTEIALLEKDYEKAYEYLHQRYNNYLKHPQRHRIMLLEKELYFGNLTYLNQLVNLTTFQRAAIEKLAAKYGMNDTSVKAQLERLRYYASNNEKIRNEAVLMDRNLAQILTEAQFRLYAVKKLTTDTPK